MSGSRRPVHVSHNAAAATITVTLPLTERTDFPSVTRFMMFPKAVNVRIIRAESDKIGFVLVLNANMPQECRRQLDRIFAPRTIQRIMAVTGGGERTFQITSPALTKAICALRQIAKFPQTPDGSRSAIGITDEAVGPDVMKRRKTESILARLADTTGRIPASRFPRPYPRELTSVR